MIVVVVALIVCIASVIFCGMFVQFIWIEVLHGYRLGFGVWYASLDLFSERPSYSLTPEIKRRESLFGCVQPHYKGDWLNLVLPLVISALAAMLVTILIAAFIHDFF